jgi:acyl-CoA thioesterase YciA
MTQPKGALTLQTLAMPANTNANGDIFGGWLVSQMDLAVGILAKSVSKGRAATVAIDNLQFIAPVKIGDLVSCYVELIKKGITSMTMQIEVWVEKFDTQEIHQVAQGTFIYVAIDGKGKKRVLT